MQLFLNYTRRPSLWKYILSPEGHLSLIDINGTHERLESAIEFELSRLLFSFQRQIIRDNEYQIRNGENGAMVIEYTERGQQLLETRQLAIKAHFR